MPAPQGSRGGRRPPLHGLARDRLPRRAEGGARAILDDAGSPLTVARVLADCLAEGGNLFAPCGDGDPSNRSAPVIVSDFAAADGIDTGHCTPCGMSHGAATIPGIRIVTVEDPLVM